jgi:hypothetical protein
MNIPADNIKGKVSAGWIDSINNFLYLVSCLVVVMLIRSTHDALKFGLDLFEAQ